MPRHPLERQLCRTVKGQHLFAASEEFELRGLVGTGAVGVVRKAVRLRDKRIFAIKFLAPDPKYIERGVFDDVCARFRREGQRGVGLEHRRLVRIHAIEENTDGSAFKSGAVSNPFIVMEFVRGRTLEHLIRRLEDRADSRLCVTPTTLAIALALAEGLTYLHKLHLVHRDVKPANIFLSQAVPDAVPTEVRLGDFGVTKWGDFKAALATGVLTASHQQGLGTLKYMSPEQATRPKEVSVRSDMFSLGVLLYELFTGRILSSPHHVFEVMNVRSGRGSTGSKLHLLGRSGTPLEETVLGVVLEMFHTGPNSRPSAENVAGRMRFCLERLQEDGRR